MAELVREWGFALAGLAVLAFWISRGARARTTSSAHERSEMAKALRAANAAVTEYAKVLDLFAGQQLIAESVLPLDKGLMKKALLADLQLQMAESGADAGLVDTYRTSYAMLARFVPDPPDSASAVADLASEFTALSDSDRRTRAREYAAKIVSSSADQCPDTSAEFRSLQTEFDDLTKELADSTRD